MSIPSKTHILSSLFTLASAAALAAPIAAPLVPSGAVQMVDWTRRCVFVDDPWGGHEHCRPAWIEPQTYDPGDHWRVSRPGTVEGWAQDDDDWRRRRHWRRHHEDWDD